MMMQIHPRFGAILVKELSFVKGSSQYPVLTAVFQLTGEDKDRFASLIDSDGEVRISKCDESSGGFDREFRLSYNALKERPWGSGSPKNYVDQTLFKTVRSFIQQTPLTDKIKAEIIRSLESITGRKGPEGAISKKK